MPTIIRTRHLSKRYGQQFALKELDLEVVDGEVLGYLGPNGAGKTTTIRLLLGLIAPTSGEATLFGFDAQRRAVEIHRRLAYVPGEANLWPSLTGQETLTLLGRVHGRVDRAYRDELISRFDFDPSKTVRSYSKGNRQKLILIAALMTRAELLILDEPTSGLDPLMEQVFRQCIQEARTAGQIVLAGLAAGFFTWAGAVSHHTYVALPTLLEAGLNATISGVFVLGASALVVGVRPRLSAPACYGIVAWSFLVDLLGALIRGADWLRDSSLFTHVALAPAGKRNGSA
ncbi:MAG TPA: ATP-binding cassette domain-containing protein [Chloroflexota bacterium]|nr:ATP-binding cassette domain-containing protein [Chloroflexota bacterium]